MSVSVTEKTIAIFAVFGCVFVIANYRYPAIGCELAVVILILVKA